MQLKVETKEVGSGWNGDSGFRFRIVATDGHSIHYSGWARYTQVAMLRGKVAISPYYTDHSDIILVSPEQALEYIAICEEN